MSVKNQEASSERKVIIFGATGAIGTELAKILSTTYPHWQIQAVTRDTTKSSFLVSLELANVTMIQGDPLDAQSVSQLIQKDCNIIFSCVGFHKYEAKYWSQHWPIVVHNLLNAMNSNNNGNHETQLTEARRRTKQRLVFCDNLYAYGAGHDGPINTQTPTLSVGRKKGKLNIRSWMHQVFDRHMKDHPGTLTVVKASDFFGPRVTDTSVLGDTITGRMVKGESTALAIGSVQPIHDFCYTRDLANALALVAEQDNVDKACDRFWICPHAIHGKSIQQIANDIASKVHNNNNNDDGPTNSVDKNVNFSVLNKFLLYLLSPFMPLAREMIEMVDFWTMDYQIDDSEFCTTFHVQATDYDEALDDLIQFYKNRDQ